MSITSFIARGIERKLGGYKVQLNTIDAALPEKLWKEKSVAVIGGGLAEFPQQFFLPGGDSR